MLILCDSAVSPIGAFPIFMNSPASCAAAVVGIKILIRAAAVTTKSPPLPLITSPTLGQDRIGLPRRTLLVAFRTIMNDFIKELRVILVPLVHD